MPVVDKRCRYLQFEVIKGYSCQLHAKLVNARDDSQISPSPARRCDLEKVAGDPCKSAEVLPEGFLVAVF